LIKPVIKPPLTSSKLKKSFKSLFVVSLLLIGNLTFTQQAQAVDPCPNLTSINNISGLTQWLRADCVNGDGSTPTDGTSITTWQDVSGNNNDASVVSGQASPTFQSDNSNLINNLPILNFTRTNDSSGTVLEVPNIDLRAITLPDVSIFTVYKSRRQAGDDADILGVWGIDDGGWDRFFLTKYQNTGNNGLISLGPNSSNLDSSRITNAAVDGETKLLTAIYDGNVVSGTNSGVADASKIYFSGELIRSFADSTSASGAKSRLYIGWDGDGSTFRGDIAEFIIFNRVLTTAELKTVNGYLNDKYSLNIAAASLPSAPAAPTSLVATGGDGQASISFTAGSDRGTAISNYKYSLDGTTYTALSPIDVSSPITIPGLTNGTSYSIYLKAVNANGDGTASTAVSVTPSTTPAAPTSLVATAGDGQASISFTAGSNGGSAITNYKYSIDGTTYTALSPVDTSSPITIPGLTNGTSYSIYLKAVNANGDGTASTAVSVTPSTTPSAPTTLSATAGDGSATISFTAGSNGGSAITNYKYSLDGTTYSALSPADGSSPITIPGLTNGTSYTIYLKAVNANGDSSASTSVSVTPAVPPAESSSGGGSTSSPTPTPTPTPKPTPTKTSKPAPSPNPKPTAQITLEIPTEPKAGTPKNPEPLLKKLIEEVTNPLKPFVFNIFTQPSPSATNSTFDSKKALEVSTPIADKKVVELPSLVRIDNELQPSKLVVIENTTLQVVTEDGGLINLQAKDGEKPIPVNSTGKVQMVRSNTVNTQGIGMKPNSEFAVYLFSEPTLLGIGKSDASGKFFASFIVDKNFPLGNHTLQVNGILPNGKISSISMPVTVVENAEIAQRQAMPKTIFVDENPVTKATNTLYFLIALFAILILLMLFGGFRFLLIAFKRRKDEEEEENLALQV
jgi:hypothetical protein